MRDPSHQRFCLAMVISPKDSDSNDTDNELFWKQQRALIDEMSGSNERAVRAEQKAKFAKRRGALVADTAYFGFFLFCILWTAFDNPFVAFSYGFGATLGLAYAYGLGKYVESLGKTTLEAPEPGEGVGQARFAFLIILFIIVGKFRDQGLLELPASKWSYCGLLAGHPFDLVHAQKHNLQFPAFSRISWLQSAKA